MTVMCMQAQRFVVFEFKAAAGITQAGADSVSMSFISNFHPKGCTLVKRAYINKTIADQGFSIQKMTSGQIIRVGQLLDANMVTMGIVGIDSGECHVEARIVNVVTGAVVVQYNAFYPYGNPCEQPMKSLAKRMSEAFDSTMQTLVNEHFVDLGLPSGTLWKDRNENGFYDYDAAIKDFGESLPNREHYDELRLSCRWYWNGNGYKVVGPNGASIVMPAAGYRSCGGSIYDVGTSGLYWTSDLNGSNCAWCLHFLSSMVHMNYDSSCGGISVRLVRSK